MMERVILYIDDGDVERIRGYMEAILALRGGKRDSLFPGLYNFLDRILYLYDKAWKDNLRSLDEKALYD